MCTCIWRYWLSCRGDLWCASGKKPAFSSWAEIECLESFKASRSPQMVDGVWERLTSGRFCLLHFHTSHSGGFPRLPASPRSGISCVLRHDYTRVQSLIYYLFKNLRDHGSDAAAQSYILRDKCYASAPLHAPDLETAYNSWYRLIS